MEIQLPTPPSGLKLPLLPPESEEAMERVLFVDPSIDSISKFLASYRRVTTARFEATHHTEDVETEWNYFGCNFEQAKKQALSTDNNMLIRDWKSFVISASDWIECDGDDEQQNIVSQEQLAYELEFCSVLKPVLALVIRLRHGKSDNLAKVLKKHFESGSELQIWVRVPVCNVDEKRREQEQKKETLGSNEQQDQQTESGVVTLQEKEPCVSDENQQKEVQQTETPVSDKLQKAGADEKEQKRVTEPWHWWCTFRRSLDNPIYLTACLELSAEMDASKLKCASVERWLGETVIGYWLLPSCIRSELLSGEGEDEGKTNQHCKFLKRMLGYGGEKIYCIFDGVPPDWPELDPEFPCVDVTDPLPGISYEVSRTLWEIWGDREEVQSNKDVSMGGRSCRDGSCTFVQPLIDDVLPSTYDSWEEDSTKYQAYREGIRWSLYDVGFNKIEKPIVIILGAGQGPLVSLVYKAIFYVREKLARNGQKITFKPIVHAVEKNPLAWPVLTERNEKEWKSSVELHFCDFRRWFPRFKADVVVSELIGGFACNELSPECLDGALHLMKESTLSCPSRYCNYLMPIMSQNVQRAVAKTDRKPKTSKADRPSKLRTIAAFDVDPETKARVDARYKKEMEEKKKRKAARPRRYALDANERKNHILYLSRAHNRFDIGEEKELFKFIHPNFPTGSDKYGRRRLSWTVEHDCELTGFAGTFNCWLKCGSEFDKWDTNYYGIKKEKPTQTIHPSNYDRLYAWYPVYFPLEKGILCSKGDVLEVEFGRFGDSEKVWYEWQVLSPSQSVVHNSKGDTCCMPLVSDSEDTDTEE